MALEELRSPLVYKVYLNISSIDATTQIRMTTQSIKRLIGAEGAHIRLWKLDTPQGRVLGIEQSPFWQPLQYVPKVVPSGIIYDTWNSFFIIKGNIFLRHWLGKEHGYGTPIILQK